MTADYLVGLDLAQTQDFTALAVLERRQQHAGGPGAPPPDYALRHLRRFPLGTPYTEVVRAIAHLAGTHPLSGSPLVVDQTGVGRPVVDMLRQASGRVVPVTITGGHAVTRTDDGSYHVPKKELVASLQVVMQARRLRIARGLTDAATLARELQSFQVRITTAAHETFGAWRVGQHDDLVLAVALACWWGERIPPAFEGMRPSGGGSLVAEAPEGVFLT